MNPSSSGKANARPYPPRQSSFPQHPHPLNNLHGQMGLRRGSSPSSDASSTSHQSTAAQPPPTTTTTNNRPPLYLQASAAAAASSSNLNVVASANRQQSQTRNGSQSNEYLARGPSPAMASVQLDHFRHRPRQHSQGFFEPSLPTASYSNNFPTTTAAAAAGSLSTSQIAAQAAMHVQKDPHNRQRSQTIPEPVATNQNNGRRRQNAPSPINTTPPLPTANLGSLQIRPVPNNTGSQAGAATTAASAAYPRSPLASPAMPAAAFDRSESPMSEREQKPGKERSRIKLFSKNKGSSSKDAEKKVTIMQSPTKVNVYSHPYSNQSASQSTQSLADSMASASASASLYAGSNASSSTLVPIERRDTGEKEKHRHHFLSRQKNKHRDKDDHHGLALSSASSNSKPSDPSAPKSLYSFVPSSPGPNSTTFNKSISGFDLRHGGRALREKRKEERAVTNPMGPSSSAVGLGLIADPLSRDREPAMATLTADFNSFGPASNTSAYSQPSEQSYSSAGLSGFGLSGMTAEDAWPFLKARLLNIFEGQDLQTPVEDFNRLVVAHLQRCIHRKAPNIIIEDVRELLRTGFLSLDQTLRKIPDERLVPYLVEMWASVFGTILPFMQAVFLPLDLELKGRGPLMTAREAADFWGAMPTGSQFSRPGTANTIQPVSSTTAMKAVSAPPPSQVAIGSLLDMRTLVLAGFRDCVMLPRYDTLFTIFSRLSLDSINAGPASSSSPEMLQRPGTAASSTSASATDPSAASYNSQGSTMLESSTAGSLGARSRATSNTSTGSLGSQPPQQHPQQRPHANSHGSSQSRGTGTDHHGGGSFAMDSARVTQTVARMLQCVSVLASLQVPEGVAAVLPPYSASEHTISTSSSSTTTVAASASGTASVSSSGASNATATTSDGDGEDAEQHSQDEQDPEAVATKKMQRLSKELTLNWLGRGRTGRNRRGFVGTKLRAPPPVSQQPTIISSLG